MPKRSRNDYEPMETIEEDYIKKQRHESITNKRNRDTEVFEPRKRHRHVTEDYVDKLEKDNMMMRNACMEAGVTIESLRQKVKQLEFLLNLQRTQMERHRVDNNVVVY